MSTEASTIAVAVGVIRNQQQRYLVAKRPQQNDHGGLWEFPGGKIEKDESVQDALSRELLEEVNLQVVTAEPLLEVTHRYPKYTVILHTWLITNFTGEPQGLEGQPLDWVTRAELEKLAMPEASYAIIEVLD